MTQWCFPVHCTNYSHLISVDLPLIASIHIIRGKESEKRATIATPTLTAATKAIVIVRTITAVETMMAKAESKRTIVNDTRATVDIAMPMRTRSVGDPTPRYPPKTARIGRTICAKSDRSVRSETIE